jgi:PBP1b-binding outer membrane lipoprotein LpoB
MKRVMILVVAALIPAFALAQDALPTSATAPSAAPALKVRTVVVDLIAHNPMPDDNVEAVTKSLYHALEGSGKYDVVDRTQVQAALTPDQVTCEAAACAIAIARKMGASKVIFGNVTKGELIYTLHLEELDVETGRIVKKTDEKVAGHMGDVAYTGVTCAVQTLTAESKEPAYQKGDWRRARGQGLGFRLSLVMPLPIDVQTRPSDNVDINFDEVSTRPTIGGGVHYDAMFRMPSGAEFHYTPSVEAWFRQSDFGADILKRYGEWDFNITDVRFFFTPTSDQRLTFYFGMGAAFLLRTFHAEDPVIGNPPKDATWVKAGAAANAMVGIEHAMKRIPWTMNVEVKAKFWAPSVFRFSYGMTRPFGKKAAKEEKAEEKKQQQAPATGTEGGGDFAPVEPAPAQ